jgi:predicted nucleic acid-binding Zn ribbon protein
MSNPTRRGPRPLSDILGELFTVRGYGRLHARQELEDAWNRAVGDPGCHQTRLGEVRRGVLNVTVAHSTLLEELSAFRKSILLKALRSDAPATVIHDIRFKVGPVVPEVEPGGATGLSSASGRGEITVSQPVHPSRRTGHEKRSKRRQASGPDPVGS